MRIKIDENIPARAANILRQFGHETDTVPQQGLTGQDDIRIWEAAQESGCFFITQDLDFSDIRQFAPGTHYGLMLVRLRSPGRNALVNRIQMLFQTESVENWKGCFVVITDHKLRVRYPMKTSDN
jgi:predicted nuclease of predicted toxin-antitoxin system